MKFVAPAESIAHQSLLHAAEKSGHDRDALRRLLWLINAHPNLVAHAQVFENILAMLGSPACEAEQLAWAGAWTRDVPDCHVLCDWIVRSRQVLSSLPGLNEFDRQPRNENDNPHLGYGVARHGVMACLWSRHELSPSYPPRENRQDGAKRYFGLQIQVLLSYIESRHRLSDLDTYERYTGEDESPVAPSPTAGLSVAVREFSHAQHEALLAQFPDSASPVEYANALSSTEFDLDERFLPGMLDFGENTGTDAIRYLETIRRYFRRFALVMGGWVPPQKKRKARPGPGGHGWRSGFVHYQPGSHVLISRREDIPEDPDIPYQQGDRVWVELDNEEDRSSIAWANEIEQLENLQEIFQLYDPEDLEGRIQQMRLQDLARESHAQQFSFDYARLTKQELFDLYVHLEQVISEYLQGSPNNVQKARNRARAALIVKVMLVLGLSREHARQLKFTTIGARQFIDGDLPIVEAPTLLLVDSDGNCPVCGPVAGFCMPAIGPRYRQELPEELDDINRPLADGFVLPDHIGVGRQLHDYRALR